MHFSRYFSLFLILTAMLLAVPSCKKTESAAGTDAVSAVTENITETAEMPVTELMTRPITEPMTEVQTETEEQTEPQTETVTELPMTSENSELAAQVDHYLDLLMVDVGSYSGVQSVRDKHPETFDALVSLGAEALPYLQTSAADVPAMIVDDAGMKRMQRAAMAMWAAYKIDPSLYDLKVISPDGTTAATAKVGSFMGLDWGGSWTIAYDGIVITDAVSGTEMSRKPFPELLLNLQLEWSADSRHVVYQHGIGGQHGFITGGLYDTAINKIQPFPEKEAFWACLCPMAPGLTDLKPSDVEGISHTVLSWTDDGYPVIRFDFRVGIMIGVTGIYRFDPVTGDIYDIEAHVNHFTDQ